MQMFTLLFFWTHLFHVAVQHGGISARVAFVHHYFEEKKKGVQYWNSQSSSGAMLNVDWPAAPPSFIWLQLLQSLREGKVETCEPERVQAAPEVHQQSGNIFISVFISFFRKNFSIFTPQNVKRIFSVSILPVKDLKTVETQKQKSTLTQMYEN